MFHIQHQFIGKGGWDCAARLRLDYGVIMKAVRLVLVISVFAVAASGQSVVDVSRLSDGLKSFEKRADDRPLRCDLVPLKPRLNFTFRFESGYVVRVPMSQFSGPGHAWGFLTRVAPQGRSGAPVYLAGTMRLPNVPPTKVVWETGGFYVLGEGRYHVSWKMFDDSGRVCRKEWDIEAKLRRNEREVKMMLPPNTVADLALRGLPDSARISHTDDAAPLRLTVLLHAAPVFPRRTKLGFRDRMMLLSTLSSLLERVPARAVRLVVFNLAQQKELYRNEGFGLDSLGEVAQALDGVQLQTVDYHVLQNRGGHLDLVADLINSEIMAKAPSDVVVFLGPEAPYWDKVRREDLDKPKDGTGSAPRFYYLQYRYPIPQQAAPADTIAHTVSELNGKTVIVRTPGEFAKAIEQIERR